MTPKRPLRSLTYLWLLLVAILLVGCGTRGDNTNWPSLSTAGDIVYVSYGAHVVAYDTNEQRELWSYPEEASQALLYAAAEVVNGRVIFGDFGVAGGLLSSKPTVTVYSLNTEQTPPQPVWSNTTSADGKIVARALYVEEHGLVYLGTDADIFFALDAETGEEVWRFSAQHAFWGQPAYRDNTLYITSLDRNLYALNAVNGDVKWKTKLDGAIAGRPAINDNLIYVGTFGKNVYALDIESGAEVWQIKTEDWVWGAPTYNLGNVYFADLKGNVYAVDGESGSPLWQTSVAYPVHTAPAVHGNMIYIASDGDPEAEGGLLTAFSQDGTQIWSQKVEAPLHTTPVIIEEMVIVTYQGDESVLIAYDANNGVQKWRHVLPQ